MKPEPTRVSGRIVIWTVAAFSVILGASLFYLARPRPRPPLPVALDTRTGRMHLVAYGVFRYGDQKKASIPVPAYYIDEREVSNANWQMFCRETGRPLPPGFPSDQPSLPVTNITILEAQDFAKWAGKRLPNALEWEKAARGLDGRAFPWGNEPKPGEVNLEGSALQPVDANPRSASPLGALNMLGNAAEFVAEPTTPGRAAVEEFQRTLQPPPGPKEPWYAVMGGSFATSWNEAMVWRFTAAPARYRSPLVGFRCVKNAPL